MGLREKAQVMAAIFVEKSCKTGLTAGDIRDMIQMYKSSTENWSLERRTVFLRMLLFSCFHGSK
ncbi:MAG: hypothetical protein PHW41_00845, partial [Eubacteriales bacterium]|nr:hypothetical protein [Eubacteriales bacterium]